MIEVKNLKKSFNGIYILKGLSLKLEKGKINLIIGKSGSGKTVFLKCLLNLLKPCSGEIFYNGINNSKKNSKYKKNFYNYIGTVFQSGALFDYMSVEENVSFPLVMFTDKSKKEIKNDVYKILERVNLYNSYNKYPLELSGGMRKRVAIARAVINNPKFLFCDEPNSGLDPKTSEVIDQLIYSLTKEYKMTTVITTHDMNSVIDIGEKIIFLNNGLKEWEGDYENILKTNNKLVIDFIYSSSLLKKIRNTFILKK